MARHANAMAQHGYSDQGEGVLGVELIELRDRQIYESRKMDRVEDGYVEGNGVGASGDQGIWGEKRGVSSSVYSRSADEATLCE